MKLKAKPLAVIIFVILFGGIAFTTAMGWWQTKTDKEPVKFTEGDAAGQYDPADIRGSYLFGDVSELFTIPLDDLKTAFNVPDDVDTAAFAVKSVEAQYADSPVEIGTQSIRLFVAFYKGLPFNLTEEIYLPAEAVVVLKLRTQLSPEQLAYLGSHSLASPQPAPVDNSQPSPATTPDSTAIAPAQGQGTPSGDDHTQPARTITGQTTFQDLLNWGVTQEAIELVLGGTMPDPSTFIKDYYRNKGEEFSAGKTAFQTLVDAVN